MVDDETARDSIFSANKGNERRSLNKIEIVSIRILERWDEAINTFQLWREHKIADDSQEEPLRNKIKAVLYALFIMNKELFKRRLKPNDFDSLELVALSMNAKSEELAACFSTMNECFDDLGLVRVDLQRKTESLETINKKKGFD